MERIPLNFLPLKIKGTGSKIRNCLDDFKTICTRISDELVTFLMEIKQVKLKSVWEVDTVECLSPDAAAYLLKRPHLKNQ